MPRKKPTQKEKAERMQAIMTYNAEYHKKYYQAFNFRFNKETQADIIAKLEEVPNKTEYLANLIRADLEAK